jgi:hypothetical protein
MGLPKIDVPVYNTELPSTGELIKFRPFLVKEQKQLLIAQGGDVQQQYEAVQDIVRACTFDKLNVATAPAYDVEYLFLQIRARSVGENIDLVLTCGECENKQNQVLDITTVQINKPDNHQSSIDLGNGLTLNLKDPTLQQLEAFKINAQTGDGADAIIGLVASSITNIWRGDENFAALDYSPAEMVEFVENLSPQNLEKLEGYFATMPSLRHSIEYKCEKCGADNSADMEGLQSFFV